MVFMPSKAVLFRAGYAGWVFAEVLGLAGVLPLWVIYAGLAAGHFMFLFCRFATPALPTRSCFVLLWPEAFGFPCWIGPAASRLPM